MKKVIMMMALMMCFAVTAFSQDTLVVKAANNKTDTTFCEITRVTSNYLFYTENKIKKSILLFNVAYYSKNSAITNCVKPEIKEEVKLEAKEKVKKTAGDELITSTKHYYIGTALVVIGGGVACLGAVAVAPPALILSGVIMLTGEILIIESRSHILKAGIILNQ